MANPTPHHHTTKGHQQQHNHEESQQRVRVQHDYHDFAGDLPDPQDLFLQQQQQQQVPLPTSSGGDMMGGCIGAPCDVQSKGKLKPARVDAH